MEDGPTDSALTPAQWLFLEALLRSGTVRAAAKKCGTPERTCRYWRRLPAFRAVMEEVNAERRAEVSLMIRRSAPKAVRTLVRMLKAKADRDRIRAAQTILAQERGIVEQEELLARLVALEEKGAEK